MQIVIPMAGQGKRFLDAGYTTPKPLIEIGGKPMIEYVARLFSPDDQILYICNTTDLEETPMRKVLEVISPKGTIVSVPFKKKGPVYHTLKAEKYISDSEPVIVNYCDFNMDWNYTSFTRFVGQYDLDGCIVCYKGFHPHLLGPNLYASVRTDEKNNFLEIKEKYSFTENKMESWQSCGTYYFKSGKIMKKYFQELVSKKLDINGEYYASQVYNHMHEDGLKIKVFPIDYFCQWGAPEDLAAYTYWAEVFKNK